VVVKGRVIGNKVKELIRIILLGAFMHWWGIGLILGRREDFEC
jgi:hypothetical protein